MKQGKSFSLIKSIMLSVFMIACLLYQTTAITPVHAGQGQATLRSDDPNHPTSVVKLIFIHHSTGQNWLADDNGGLGIALGQNNYFVSDTNYGWGPGSIGSNTDIPNWLDWFRSSNTPTYMAALYAESGQHSTYTRTLTNPGGENEIIMFKSCFPNSALSGNPNDPPSASGSLTVGHAKYVYNQLLLYFREHPNKLFVVITAPPLSDPTYAANARAFNQWLMNNWLTENKYPLQNVAVFDFYNVLTGPDNHHRYYNGQIQHIFTPGSNTLYYPSGDDHPSQAGNIKATNEFVPLLNIFYHRWKNSLAVPTIQGCPIYPADNIWNVRVDSLPVHTRSSQWINTIGRSTGFHMDFGSGTWDGGPIGIPYNIVDGSVTKVPVFFDYDDQSDDGPYPIPASPLIEYGSDHHILILERTTCTLYEIYNARYAAGAWYGGSGAIWSLNSDALRPDTWTSADAAGLPMLPGLVQYDEIVSGEIKHAIRFTAAQTNGYIWPARHLTSNDPSSPQIPPMGARFRLKASFNITSYSLEMQILLQAMKRYGIILADNGSNWYVSGAPDERWNNDMLHTLDALTGDAFEAVDVSGLMVDPDSGATQTGVVPGFFGKSTPSNGATGQSVSPTISWTSSSGTTSYEYCYDTTNDNACNNWTSNGTSTSKTFTNLTAGTTYYWHVRAINGTGITYSNDSDTTFWSFTTSSVTYMISGSTGIGGTVLTYINGTSQNVTADTSGNYSITVPYGWFGTVTPSKTGYVFTPTNRTYTNVAANQTNQDYWVTFPASWAGGLTITSDRSIVAVGRPHAGAEVMTYNGFGSGLTTSYVPMLFKNAWGSYNSALYIQNTDAVNSATVSIKYYDASGTLTCTVPDTITSLAIKSYWVPSVTCLPDGWVGGAVITANRNIVSVGRPHLGSQVTSYDGFGSGSLNMYVPMLFKTAFGGSYNAALYVQNTDAANIATFSIKYYDASGTLTCSVTGETLNPLASRGYWVPSVACLPDGWVGGAVVTANRNIVAIGRPHVGDQITSYNGIPAGQTSLRVPMLFKNAWGSYNAALYIQNTDTVNSASITINYYDSAGNLTCSVPDTLSALATKGYWVPSVTCLPDGWAGGAVVTANRNIVAVGRPHVGAEVATYSGVSVGSANLYLPMLFKGAFGSYDSAFYVQNTDDVNAANVTFKFYDTAGNLSCMKTASIPKRATVGYWVPSLTCTP